jgi:hypothetical protein
MVDHQWENGAQGLVVAMLLLPNPNDISKELQASHLIDLAFVLQEQIDFGSSRVAFFVYPGDRIEQVRVTLSQMIIHEGVFLELKGVKIE